MAVNPSDTQFAIIKETVEGTTPATGKWLKIDHIPGTSPTYTSDLIESPVISTGRASGGNRKVAYRVEGGLNTHFSRDAATELLLASAFSGTWVETGATGEKEDVLKAGAVDTSLTIEKKIGNLYTRYKGVQVSGFNLSVEADGNAEASFTVLGMDRENATTAKAGLTYDNASNKLKLAGADVKNVSIAGLASFDPSALEFSVEHTREAQSVFGKTSAVAIGTSGNRVTSLSITFYRTDFNPETVLAGNNAVAVSFEIGEGDEGYRVTLPSATASIPQDSEDGSKALVTVEFSAKRDNAAGTDVMITRL